MHCCWAHFRAPSEAPVAPVIPSTFIFIFLCAVIAPQMASWQLQHRWDTCPCTFEFSRTRIFFFFFLEMLKLNSSHQNQHPLPFVHKFGSYSWQVCHFLNGIGMSFCLRGLRAAFHSCFYFAAAPASILPSKLQFLQSRIHKLLR